MVKYKYAVAILSNTIYSFFQLEYRDRYVEQFTSVRSSISLSYYFTVTSSSHQVYPSEYAYWDDLVNRADSASANCRRYSAGVFTEQYVHCDGTQRT